MRSDLSDLGLLVSEEKCNWNVSQEVVWTGLRINTREFKVYIPDMKIERAEAKLVELLEKKDEEVELKKLASVVGLVISFGPGMGRACRFFTRFSSIIIAKVSEESGWKSKVKMPEEVVKELYYWRKNLRVLNGQMIRKSPGVKVVRPRMVYSDAGGHMAGGGQVENKRVVDNTVFQVNLTEDEVKESSTYRELRGVEEGLRALGPELRGQRVRWHNDNWSCCKIVELGSMKPKCMEVAVNINNLIRYFDLEFEIVWQRRNTEEIRFADRVSKDFDFSDYRISKQDFLRLQSEYGNFSCDYFASDYSYRMLPFYSRFRSGKSKGSDAFSSDWGEGFGYFHPPVALVPRVLDKAEQDGARGILLVPDWKGSVSQVVMDKHSKRIKLREKFRPFFECPDWFENDTFKGWPKFEMSIYEFLF